MADNSDEVQILYFESVRTHGATFIPKIYLKHSHQNVMSRRIQVGNEPMLSGTEITEKKYEDNEKKTRRLPLGTWSNGIKRGDNRIRCVTYANAFITHVATDMKKLSCARRFRGKIEGN